MAGRGGPGATGAVGLRFAWVSALVAALVLAVGWAVADGGGRGDQPNAGRPSEYARYLRLDEGRSGTVAVSRSDPIAVWWRGPDARTWSAPEVVRGGAGRYLTSTNVRVAGSTLAIRASYNTQPPWDDENDDPGVATSVFIVCRPRSCVTSDHYEQLQEPPCRRGSCVLSRPESKGVSQVPELSSAGDQVYFGSTEGGYVVWSLDEGLRELRPENLPDEGVLGTPMLAPDGSLRVVSGRGAGHTCQLTLLTSEPVKGAAGSLDYSEQVSTSAPTRTGDCATTLEAFTSDQLLVHTDRAEPAYLVRTGDTWQATRDDPTGMLRYQPRPGRHAEGSVVRTGYWHWREVMTGSPDGRRLVAQVHVPGAARWTEPVTVAVAPQGLDCFEIAPTSTPDAEPFYVTMRCRSRSSPGAGWTYVGVHAVTEDGLTWDSAIGDHLPTRVGEDLWFGGAPAHKWTPDDGLVEVGLPVPANSETFQVDDGTLVLVTAQPIGSRCRLVVRVAERGRSDWSAPLTNPDPFVPAREPCRPVGQYDGRVVSLYFLSTGPRWLPAVVTRHGDEWVVTARRRVG